MIVRAAYLAIAVGIVLRLLAFEAHEHPRGDVVLDVGVVRSLVEGEGFRSGYERSILRVAGADAPLPPRGWADQHAPLWPLLGALLTPLAGSPFAGLQLASLLFGFLLIVLVWRVTDRLTEGLSGAPDGLPALAAGLVSLSFVAVDFGANGSLYVAQACLVLLLVEALSAPSPSAWRIGLALGALLLINHQCVVLVPVPLLVLVVGALPGRRGRAVLVGIGATIVAGLCQLPWWLRNASVFDDPFYSVNSVYFLYRAGVPFAFAVEDGLPVVRFAETLGVGVGLRAALGFLKPNALYVLTTGLAVAPGLLGVVGAGAVPLGLGAVARRERRLVALILCLACLVAVAVLWPATKLRYLVAPLPLVVLLGVRLLAEEPRRMERILAAAVGVVWAGAVLVTLDDVLGEGEDARPVRWAVLTGGGLLVLVMPLVVWLRSRRERAGRWLVGSGIVVALAASLAVAAGPQPRTSYHGTVFAPDFFGVASEPEREREAAAIARVHEELVARGVDAVAGPIELLAHAGTRLLELSPGLDEATLARTLASSSARDGPSHVVLFARDVARLGGTTSPGERLSVTADDGAVRVDLEVVEAWPEGDERVGVVLLRRAP